MSAIAFGDIDEVLCLLPVNQELGLIITIPCYKEETIVDSVLSILHCDKPSCDVEIIILINTPESAETAVKELNEQSYDLLKSMTSRDGMSIIPIHVHKIPAKKAGVGMARRLAMDEAYRRLHLSSHPIKVIGCYDADCSCEPNYLVSLYDHFSQSKLEAVSIHFEHPAADLNGLPHQRAIFLYELHLRYFIQMQQLIGLPFALHTVGSSMACTADGYYRIGGMNKRKAGEDFYFLQKFIQDNQCDRLMKTTVYPSARESDRVPFGTGKAIGDMLAGEDSYLTYQSQSFIDLENLVNSVDQLFQSSDIKDIISSYPVPVIAYLKTISFTETISRLKGNTKTSETFRKAFYQFFDAFQLMKYLHFVRDRYYPNIDVIKAAEDSLKTHHQIDVPSSELLNAYRQLDKQEIKSSA